jgi:hypothetical protein
MPDPAPSDSDSGSSWTPAQLRVLDDAIEIEVSASRHEGGLSRWTPIWVVVAGADVFVRTWHRRDTGWYGAAARSAAARIRVGDVSIDVIVTATGVTDAAAVDAGYRKKYGDLAARSMVTAEAAASTLRLDPRAD